MSIPRLPAVFVTSALLAGCAAPAPPEATSLLGTPLRPVALDDEVRRDREDALARARDALEAAPDDEDAIIWVGRRTAYLGRYREAIDVYSRGLRRHPESAKLRRHRGHRFITVRRLGDAVADLDHAARLVEGMPDEVEPDGMPNRLNIPTSTLQTNIAYHLGLARYLQGRWEPALAAYRRCLEFSANPDMEVATRYWLYLTLRRLGRDAEAADVAAPVTAELDVIENHAYHRLLLLFKGDLDVGAVTGGDRADADQADVQDATVAYGVAMWHLLSGRPERARARFERIVAGPAWAAFGHIAAEAELARSARRGVSSRSGTRDRTRRAGPSPG